MASGQVKPDVIPATWVTVETGHIGNTASGLLSIPVLLCNEIRIVFPDRRRE